MEESHYPICRQQQDDGNGRITLPDLSTTARRWKWKHRTTRFVDNSKTMEMDQVCPIIRPIRPIICCSSSISSIEEADDDEYDVTNDEITDDDAFFQNLYKQYEECRKGDLEKQLKEVREQKHNLYNGLQEINKFETNYLYNESDITNPNDIWHPPNTTLILGESMLNQMDAEKLSKSTKRNVKVRSFRGAKVIDMYAKLHILLRKKPSTIILHVGTNDTTSLPSHAIVDELLKLKNYIDSELAGVSVIISCPITRMDNGKAKLTINRLIGRMEILVKVKCLLNLNIKEKCIGRKRSSSES